MKLTGAQKFEKLCSDHENIWMGIVNLTPDSFSDGGKYVDKDVAIFRVNELINAGANIIDFGGASSRPQSRLLEPAEELQRVYEVISKVRKEIPSKVLVSIDTYSPIVARELAKEGLIDIINDIFSGTKKEKIGNSFFNTAQVAAEFELGYVIMHMQGTPENMQLNPSYTNCTSEVFSFLEERIKFSEESGVKFISIDPGVGFGKALDDNLELLSEQCIKKLVNLKKPVLIGLSRKSFFGKLYPELSTPLSRDHVSKQFETQSLQFGAKIIRSHIMPSELNLS